MTKSDCAICGLLTPTAENLLLRAGFVVAYADDDVVALVAGDRPGFFVAPRAHAGVPFTSPGNSAVVLAFLRQVVEEVKSLYDATEATIEPVTDLPGALGHVCYHVAPDHGNRSAKQPDVDARVHALAARLRGHVAAPTEQRSNIRPTRRRPSN